MRNRRLSIAAESNRFQILRTHHRPDAATAGVAAFIADRGEADAMLTRYPDGRHPHARTTQLRMNGRFRVMRCLSSQMIGGSDLDVLAVNEHVHKGRRLAGEHQGVDTKALQFESEMARRE